MEYLALFEKYLTGGKQQGNQWRFNCPRCDVGHHANARHLWVNPTTGQWRCFLCESHPDGRGRGNAITFAKLMGEQDFGELTPTERTPQRKRYFNQGIATEVYTWLVANAGLVESHREHLTDVRGFEDPDRYGLVSTNKMGDRLRKEFSREELLASGMFYANDDASPIVMHESVYPNRIVIPYYQGRKVQYFRSRNMGGAGMRSYLGPVGAGTENRIWGDVNAKRPYDLVITEGEFKAIAAHQFGIHTVSTPGMNAARDAVARLVAAASLREVTICFDTQTRKPENVDCAAEALASAIFERSPGTRVFRAELPLDDSVDGGQKMDIDSFIKRFGVEEFRAVLFSAREIARPEVSTAA